ncbi:MAG: heavy metal translocating P-type ATPase [Helicobacter sp.]|uniref:heavy metal translocating P-type ATPase n=1 Tax=Helicobacter sp. 10-6591 TaxID=2004998 RepID=UPI000DCD3C69|nr:heavy metal translocating P-type ATPase [Helicobacter sp. 10-6591]MDD7567646.1 heavy metal translocating P-type ATPase [Helicobacter sp.]MDY5740287.1 heavy metal translocating P-type ATPase [Helicobacter sp.]RAX53225.1 copper-translocating P-type ATPase [Helicobacter sp. 10-6591]
MQRQCSHCHLLYQEQELKKVITQDSEDSEQELYFCCNGCESVYFLLQKAQLQSFYTKLGTTTLTPPKSVSKNDLGFFDSPGFKEKYIRTDKNGLFSCSLILTNIHCSACVWLNEKILNAQTGIESAYINYTNNKLLLTWNNSIISLSQIIQLIRSIGYDALAYDYNLGEEQNKAQTSEYYMRVIVGVFCTMNIMWIAIAQYSGYFLGISPSITNILNIASFLLCSITLFYSGFVFYRSAYFGFKSGFIGMDMLVSVGASLTYLYSIYAALSHSVESYFESVSMIITFVLVGKFLEIRTKKSAGESLEKLGMFLPQNINVVENEQENNVIVKKPEEVNIGDIILALPGEKIAFDGILISPKGLFDCKAINGESLPVSKRKDEEIFSGFINLNHKILYRANKSFQDSLMSKILSLVETSLTHKPRIQNLANSISQNFSRAILLIALCCMIGWYFLGGIGFEQSLIIAISVIIIACPCALALATPLASIVGISQAYKKHIIFKQASFLEILAKAEVMVFDKTGTLTQGKPQVINSHILQPLSNQDKSLLYALTTLSTHPISLGIKEYLAQETLTPCVLQDFIQLDSKGVKAQYNGSKIVGGSLEFLEEEGIEVCNLKLGQNMLFGFGRDCKLLAVFELKDSLKSGAAALISYLKTERIKSVLLSGDRQQSVNTVAREIGIQECFWGFSPLQKASYIQELKNQGKVVVMVGDGINDALALSKSDIAISMGNGSDIALLSSDVVILDNSLKSVGYSLQLAKRTYSCIKHNIALSIAYNALSIPIALCGLVIPLFAALSMSLSSLLVVLNSLRIKKDLEFARA